MLAGGAGVGCRGFSGSMYGMYEIMSGSTLFRQPIAGCYASEASSNEGSSKRSADTRHPYR